MGRSETLLSALRQSGFENLTFDTPGQRAFLV